ncbi:MAG: hypothetical protein HKN36_02950 [Hellea sp.]|nr:hypothetical protein [Hellea sp.]
MSEKELLERIHKLEQKLEATDLDKPSDPIKPFIDKFKDLIFVVGVPAAVITAFVQLDQSLLNPKKYQRITDQSNAVEKVRLLQEYNSKIFRLQAEEKYDLAFVEIEATRGHIDRLVDDIYDFWIKYPDMYGYYEKTTLAEALIKDNRNDKAIRVVESVNTDNFETIKMADHHMLKARILYADGPGRDMQVAKEQLGAAMELALSLDSPVQKHSMAEKLLTVKLVNELYITRDCDRLLPVYENLLEHIEALPVYETDNDGNRDSALMITEAYDKLCSDPAFTGAQ